MTKIRFDTGITVTISDGWVQTPSPTMTALLNALVDSLPGELDADIARALIEKIGFGEIAAPILFAGDLRILAATVDDNAALDC